LTTMWLSELTMLPQRLAAIVNGLSRKAGSGENYPNRQRSNCTRRLSHFHLIATTRRCGRRRNHRSWFRSQRVVRLGVMGVRVRGAWHARHQHRGAHLRIEAHLLARGDGSRAARSRGRDRTPLGAIVRSRKACRNCRRSRGRRCASAGRRRSGGRRARSRRGWLGNDFDLTSPESGIPGKALLSAWHRITAMASPAPAVASGSQREPRQNGVGSATQRNPVRGKAWRADISPVATVGSMGN